LQENGTRCSRPQPSQRNRAKPPSNTPRWLGWIYLAVVAVVGLAAIPLLIVTRGGQG
jgi:hypothetical protein